MGEPTVKKLLLSAVGVVALAGFVSSANAQTQCWPSVYGYYTCATPPHCCPSFYGFYRGAPPRASFFSGSSAAPAYGPTLYAAWNAYDYRDYRNNPRWLPSYPGPRASSGLGW